jgi:hypothetical protein
VCPPVGGGRRPLQPLPQRSVAASVHGAEERHERGVDVQAAGVRQALAGQHVEPGSGAAQHRRVERAGTEVVDHGDGPGREAGAVHPHEVGARGDRLSDERRRRQAGMLGRVAEHLASAGAPGGRMGDHDLGPGGEDAVGLLDHAPQHRADQVAHRHLVLAQQHGAVVDASLRVGLEELGADAGGVQRLASGRQRAALVEEDGGGQQRRAVEQQRAHPTVRPLRHGDGVRRPEVDAEPQPARVHGITLGAPLRPA